MNKSYIHITISVLLMAVFMACEEHVKVLPASDIFIDMNTDGYEVKVNDTINLSPKITYDNNSTYSWWLKDEIVWEEKDLELIPKTLVKYEYTFKLENSRGSKEMVIPVQSMYKTDFENIKFDNVEFELDTFWTNSTNEVSFISDKLQFEVTGNYPNENWTGFTYSNLIGNNTDDNFEKYSCNSKPKNFESSVFGVMMFGTSGRSISINTADGEDHLFKSIDINNSYYVYNAIQNGSYNYNKFGQEAATKMEWVKLTISGYNKSGDMQEKVEVLLSDYTTGSNRTNTTIKDWTTINLESIGKVARLSFVMTSSDMLDGKMITPPFVCFDEIKIIE